MDRQGRREKSENITILGSTGSIGTQTLDIIRRYPDKFKAVALTAHHNWDLLAAQAREFKPERVVIGDDDNYLDLKDALKDEKIEVMAGSEAIAECAAMPSADTVVTAMVGYSGLLPTVRAIGADKRIALANKETLVVAGELITSLLKKSQSEILPVDSEHSAIYQCLQGEDRKNLRKIILTASGGPFRNYKKEDLGSVTVEMALRHPNWNMGAKVTIDSATMMNKGFEMIEAHWLFDCMPENIDVLVHPQSVIHSMVEFCDGSVKAQLGVPDMHLPISYALGYPERLPDAEAALDFMACGNLTFEKPDTGKFPLLDIAFEAIKQGGTAPCIMNAANEVAVSAFLNDLISFTDIAGLVETTLNKMQPSSDVTLENLIYTNKKAVKTAEDQLPNFYKKEWIPF